MAMSSGLPIPNAAKTMWKANDMAICERAKRKSLIPLQRDRFPNQPEARSCPECRANEKRLQTAAELPEQMRARSIRLLTSAATLGFRPSSRWIQPRVRLPNDSVSKFRVSTPGRTDYKRQNGAQQHDSSNQ